MQSQAPSRRRMSRGQSTSPSPSSSSSSASGLPQPQSRSQSQRARSDSQARSASSEDSQTVLLNRSSIVRDQDKQQESSSSIRPATRPQVDDEDLKKCWICFSDESEDTPETSEWRDPCPCALVAHEDCLLDWIADMESPSSRKRTLSPPRPVCPQCKTDIHLARPKNYIVETVKALERVSAKVTTPASLMVALSIVLNACEAHGRYSIFRIFGPEDGRRIMQPAIDDIVHPHEVHNWLDIKTVFAGLAQHWRLRVGLPLITPILILSRTSIADSLLPVLPIVFFATQGDSNEPFDLASWPPSASLTMAVLPYLRGAYNAYFERVWAEKQRRWYKEIQPRNGRDGEDTADTNAAGGAAHNNNDEVGPVDGAENHFELHIDAGIWEDWGGANNDDNDNNNENLAPALNAPPLADDPVPQQRRARPQNPPPQPAAAPAPAAGNNGNGGRGERMLSFSTTALAEQVLGALFFPSVAATTGEVLKYLLPRSWTTKPLSVSGRGSGAATGLLQEKWGRSIVGGCLFVVLKDAVMLYVRWKMACQHRRRRVLDFDRVKRKVEK